MSGVYQITFLPGARTVQYIEQSYNCYYRLPGGRELPLHGRPVWCDRCGAVTTGERIDDVAALDRRLRDLRHLAAEIRREMTRPPPAMPDAPGDRHQQEQIAELQLRRAWRLLRRSPPRCITCGSTAIVTLTNAPVHTGGGSIVAEGIGFADVYLDRRHFSPEGKAASGSPSP